MKWKFRWTRRFESSQRCKLRYLQPPTTRKTNILVSHAAALFLGLTLIVHMDSAVPQACATMQTDNNGQTPLQSGTLNWVWTSTGAFNLNQNSNGGIAGDLNDPNCSVNDYYTTVGTINDRATFSLISTYHGSNPGCASTLSMTGTLSGAGCTVANGNWNNSSGLSGSFNMTHGCYVPSGETNQVFTGWVQTTNQTPNGSAVYESAVFQQQLAPLTFNWGGRTVSETFPQPASDGCWFKNSAIPKLVTIATRNITVDSTAEYSDSIGPLVQAIKYYRQQGRTPCSLTTQQVLVIDCPNPPVTPVYVSNNYSTNTQIDTIGPRLLTVTRGNNPSVSEAFGPPAPALTLPAFLFNLFYPPH